MPFIGQRGRPHLLAPPPAPRVNPRHSLSRGLTRLWLVQPGAGSDRILNLAPSQYGIEARFGAHSYPAPTWTTTPVGPGLQFNGVDQALRVDGAAGLYNGTVNPAVTMAIIGRLDGHDSFGPEIYSQNRSVGDLTDLAVYYEPPIIKLWFASNVADGHTLECDINGLPDYGQVFGYIGAIRDATTCDARMVNYHTGEVRFSDAPVGNIGDYSLAVMDQESFGGWTGNGFIPVVAPAPVTLHAIYVWDRALSQAEMADFLADPFDMLREPIRPQPLAPATEAPGATLTTTWTLQQSGTAAAASSTPARTIITNWSLAGGQAAASSAVSGATLTTTWSVLSSTQVGAVTLTMAWSLASIGSATASATGSGATLTNAWFLLPGAASGNATRAGATLTTAWSLIAGQAGGTNTAVGATLTNTWSLAAGTASSSASVTAPRPFIGGGGMGPGGDPTLPERIRASASRAAERAFDPEGWAKAEAERVAAEQEAARRAEVERTRPERLTRSVLRFLNMTED